jgi:predicted esterase
MPVSRPAWWLLTVGWLAWPCAAPSAAQTGLHPEERVTRPTRLDWQFAAADFGPDAARLPRDYDSGKQRFQLYVPRGYRAGKAWPLVLFISPGGAPMGWSHWQKPCEQLGLFFCAPFAAGNDCPAGRRTRIVLDAFDEVRRRYRIDPEQTYLAGFSGGGRLACTIAFALPEYFGGVIPVCGTNPLNRLTYLRHRVRDRLSVAFVTGTGDFNRRENEAYMYPYFQDLKIRSRLWVVPRMAHAVPPAAVLLEVHAWLAQDLKRRQADTRSRPGLAASPGKERTAAEQAARQVQTAEAELKVPATTWRGVALLQGVVVRWGKTEAAGRARQLLKEVLADPKKTERIAQQGGEEERHGLTALARALERFGQPRQALQAWRQLAELQPDTPAGKQAAREVKRLEAAGPQRPFLGVGFEGKTTTVNQVLEKGPAHRAGLERGDVLVKLGGAAIATQEELAQALRKHKPGDKVAVEVRRGQKRLTLTVELGSAPAAGD